MVLARAVTGPPDAPRSGALLRPTQLGSPTLELSRLPTVGPVMVVGHRLLDALDILGRPQPENEEVIGGQETLAKGHQRYGRGGAPFLVEGSVELLHRRNSLRDDMVFLVSGLA